MKIGKMRWHAKAWEKEPKSFRHYTGWLHIFFFFRLHFEWISFYVFTLFMVVPFCPSILSFWNRRSDGIESQMHLKLMHTVFVRSFHTHWHVYFLIFFGLKKKNMNSTIINTKMQLNDTHLLHHFCFALYNYFLDFKFVAFELCVCHANFKLRPVWTITRKYHILK